MASVRAPATPSRANSRMAACKMASRLSSGRPREPRRDLADSGARVFILTNQLVRLYCGGRGCASLQGFRVSEFQDFKVSRFQGVGGELTFSSNADSLARLARTPE